jgi:ubiquinone/menaquinone biosynthesis C-methylase UbiE
MRRLTARRLLPHFLRAPLWGDRERWGLTVDQEDSCWQEWQGTYDRFYTENQRQGVGTTVNDAGYSVVSDIDLSGKTILEIGAGDIRHIRHWQSRPKEYLLADISSEMMDRARRGLEAHDVPYRALLVNRGEPLPIADQSVDLIISFYSLEHLHPLRPYLEDMRRVLKPGGLLIGAIPAEGGLAWGGGRLLTSRRWLKQHTSIDPDKLICWEHPNFADEILAKLDDVFQRESAQYWPLPWLPLLDINLIIRFVYRNVVDGS